MKRIPAVVQNKPVACVLVLFWCFTATDAFAVSTTSLTREISGVFSKKLPLKKWHSPAMAANTFYDFPVSNNGARCRIIAYKKGLSLEDDFRIASPMDLGGMKTEEYKALNPQGLIPCLVTDSGMAIPESDTISRYLLDRYSTVGPSFIPSSVEARARSDHLARLHDMYITTIQGCLYKAVPPFGKFSCRLEAIEELKKQLSVLNDVADAQGPYLTGAEVSLADATLFPTMIFVVHSLPKFEDVSSDPTTILGDKLGRWYEWVLANDETFTKVHEEVQGALTKWDKNGRWDTILHAGDRDAAPETIFDAILAGKIPADVVEEDDTVMVFRDISPQAPTHLLIIPKRRQGLTQLRHARKDHEGLLGHMLAVAAKVAKENDLGDYRLVVNDGAKAGQEVFHLHMHLLAGRQMAWPPG